MLISSVEAVRLRNHILFLCSCHLWNHHFPFTCCTWIKCKLRYGVKRNRPCSYVVKSSYCSFKLGRHVPSRCKDLKEFCFWQVLASTFSHKFSAQLIPVVFKRTKKAVVCSLQPMCCVRRKARDCKIPCLHNLKKLEIIRVCMCNVAI